MMMDRGDELMRNVYETGFAMDDVALYLDTHPMDQDAMNYYRFMQRANQDAIRAFEQVHGPLMVNRVETADWNWINNPWPWEGGNR